MTWLLRRNWQRFDGLGVLIALLSPIIGLLCGGLLILVFASGVTACGYLLSSDFRREFQDARDELNGYGADVSDGEQENVSFL